MVSYFIGPDGYHCWTPTFYFRAPISLTWLKFNLSQLKFSPHFHKAVPKLWKA